MYKVIELRVHTNAPITEDTRLSLQAQGLTLKNAGSSTATINKHYTLLPGETLNLAVTNDETQIVVFDASIIFSGAGSNRVEILELRTNKEQFTNYKRQ